MEHDISHRRPKFHTHIIDDFNEVSRLLGNRRAITKEDGKTFFVKIPSGRDLCNISFLWDPVLEEECSREKLIPIQKVKTYHTYAYYGFFKPTIAECVSRFPSDIDFDVFEITDQPYKAEDFNKHRVEFNSGYHVAEMTLYKLLSDQKIFDTDPTTHKVSVQF